MVGQHIAHGRANSLNSGNSGQTFIDAVSLRSYPLQRSRTKSPALAGFLVGNADGPAEVPRLTAVGASLGPFAFGPLGLLATSGGASSRSLHRAALLVLLIAPFTASLWRSSFSECPLYVSG